MASDPGETAGSLFDDWLRRFLGAGGAEPFEDLLRAHPDHAPELEQLMDAWLADLVRSLGLTGGLAEELSARFGEDVDPRVQLEAEESGDAGLGEDPDFTARVLGRLSKRPGSTRYRLKGEVADGGQGAILRVWDEDLRRHLAMKVMLGRREAPSGEDSPPVDRKQLARFLEEAQVTGQLDHPNIVPVHELGLDAKGRAYFTMKLVKGRDLKAIFDLVREGQEGWNPIKALGVLQKVCEAMSYAHDKGVVHRDLKPANVMVGRYGEVYVMDWGLARVLGQAERKDLRIRPEDGSQASIIRSERQDAASERPDSPLYTMDGDVVGTPAYMPPEQANGDLEALGPRSDVYAVGAMLYHLLSGHMPYVRPGQRASARSVLQWVKDGPPPSLVTEAPKAPLELVSITEKAMARDPSERYADMASLAADLSAFIEGRVVAAHETGAWAEARKWIRRNRPLAASLAAAVLLLVAGIASTSWLARRASRLATSERAAREEIQVGERERLLRGLILDLDALRAPFQDYDSARLHSEPIHAWWSSRARLLVHGQEEDAERGLSWRPGLAEAEDRLAALRAEARPRTEEEIQSDREAHPRYVDYVALEAELLWHRRLLGEEPWPDRAQLEAELAKVLASDASALNFAAWRLVDPDDPTPGEEVRALVLAERASEIAGDEERAAVLDTLAWARLRIGDPAGAVDAMERAVQAAGAARREAFLGFQRRLEQSLALHEEAALRERIEQLEGELSVLEGELSVLAGELAERRTWRFEQSDVSWWHDQLAELVEGLREQRDELESWESPDLQARWAEAVASIASSQHYGGLRITPQLGLVPLGADPVTGLWEFAHPGSGVLPTRGEDGSLELEEDFSLVFVLLPGGRFWMGAQKEDPTQPGYDPEADSFESPVHEVELSAFFVSKYEMTRSQWFALGGRDLEWWEDSGRNPATDVAWTECMELLSSASWWLTLPTEAQWEYGCRGGTTTPWWTGAEELSLEGREWLEVGDQDPRTPRRVGLGFANPFGLYDMHGNAWEWCLDGDLDYDEPVQAGTGLRVGYSSYRVARGGGFDSAARYARSADRRWSEPGNSSQRLGFRPARGLTP